MERYFNDLWSAFHIIVTIGTVTSVLFDILMTVTSILSHYGPRKFWSKKMTEVTENRSAQGPR